MLGEYVTKSERETEQLAAETVCEIYNKGFRIIAFTGDLGAGKTAFTRGIGKGAGYDGEVTSPTFAIVHEYIGGKFPIYHFDMYRVVGEDSLYSSGFYDYLDGDSLVVIEWSENVVDYLPDNVLKIDIRRGRNDNERIIRYFV